MATFGESVCSQSLSRAAWSLICIVSISCADILCSYSLPFPPRPISYGIFFYLPYHWYLAITAFPISDLRIVPDAKWGFGFKWLENHLISSAHLSNQASQESGHLMKCLPTLNSCVSAGGVMVTWPWSWFLRGGSLGRWGRPWLTSLFSKKKVLFMEDCWKSCSFLQIFYSSFFDQARPQPTFGQAILLGLQQTLFTKQCFVILLAFAYWNSDFISCWSGHCSCMGSNMKLHGRNLS